MPKEKLLAYFKKHLDKGFPKEKIVEKLKKSGYSEESINEVLAGLKKPESAPEEKPRASLWHPKIYGAVLILVILIAVVVVFFGRTETGPLIDGQEGLIEEEEPIPVDLASQYKLFGAPFHFSIATASDSIATGTNQCEALKDDKSSDIIAACSSKYGVYKSVKDWVSGKCDDLAPLEKWSIDQEICAATFSGDCSSLEGEKAVYCDFIVRNDLGVCPTFEGIMSEETFRECGELIRVYVAMKENNPEFCEGISTILNREACRRMIAGNANFFNDLAKAESLTAEVKYGTGDLSNCTSIEIKEIRELCMNEGIGYNETSEKSSEVIVYYGWAG